MGVAVVAVSWVWAAGANEFARSRVSGARVAVAVATSCTREPDAANKIVDFQPDPVVGREFGVLAGGWHVLHVGETFLCSLRKPTVGSPSRTPGSHAGGQSLPTLSLNSPCHRLCPQRHQKK